MREFDKNTLITKRLTLIVITLFIFIFLLTGFMRLQVMNQEQYVQKSMDNSIRKMQIYPVRGLILDSENNILVDNRSSFSIAVIPKVVNTEKLKELCEFLQVDYKEVLDKIKKQYGFRPVIIARDVTNQTLIAIEEQRQDLPGVVTIVTSKRYYPQNVNSPHIFGTIGEINPVERIMNPEYDQGEMIGKSGLEKKYEKELRGSKGSQFFIVDASGRELGDYDSYQDIPPVHGSDHYLKMNYRHQQVAESLMTKNRGALVAIDVRDGGILAFVSKPDYDPRLLTGKIEEDVWNQLQNDESRPLFSRAIQSGYPPGSTYKIVAAIAALQENIITPKWKAFCPGYFKLGRKTINCWNAKGHGSLDLYGAIKNSCNVYFFQLGLEIGLDAWSKYSKLFKFGSPTGIDLPNENSGLVPTEEYFNRVFGEGGWTKGNLANLAIGQGELLTTPIQLAQFAMILANKGVYYKPHLVDQIYDYSTRKITKFPIQTEYIHGISDDVYNIVREAMRMVCDGGTGWLGKVPNIETAGKTGSAQNPHGQTHAWFIGFAPFEKPEIAIAVIVENGGGGGAIAAPMARKFMETYFYGKLIPRPVVKADTTEIPAVETLF
ncbi:MAG TPA: penicillin-binding protein 2, partial [Caldithrix sp.]|nr:penicillin-binding protein 2 [Caldithrix sp.]